MTWYIYIIRTAAGQLYTGVTTDIERRFAEHSDGKKGARFLRGKGPLKVVYSHIAGTRSSALKIEVRIKKLTRAKKDKLVDGELQLAELIDLTACGLD